jgi:prepilin-type N-terminal cleavage/methylation domain-containing protein
VITPNALMRLRRRRAARRKGGFTLVELVVVVMVILIFLAIAAPNLASMFIFADLETSSRNLASFGARAMDQCILARDRYTVKVDLNNQEYWALRWPKVTDEDAEGGRLTGGGLNILGDNKRGSLSELLAGINDASDISDSDLEEEAQALFAEMEWHHRTVLETRARRVLEQGTQRGDGRLFDTRFTLERDEDDKVEVRLPLLQRTTLPQGVRIQRVAVGETTYSSGVVEIEITPIGLEQPVSFEMRNDDGDVYTVKWMGNTRQGIIESGWTGPVDEERGS